MASPAARRKAHHDWRRHVSDTLRWAKNGYDKGYESALWDACLFCEETNTPKPEWLRDAIERYAKDRINGVPLPMPKKNGRPTLGLRDVGIVVMVDELREHRGIFGRKIQKKGPNVRPPGPRAKPRRWPYPLIFAKIATLLPEENLTARGIEAIYKRTKKRLSNRSYLGSPFLNSDKN